MANSENKRIIYYLYEPNKVSFILGYNNNIRDIKQFLYERGMVYNIDVFGKATPVGVGGYSQTFFVHREFKFIALTRLVIPFVFVNRRFIYFDFDYYIKHGIKNMWFRLIDKKNIIPVQTELDHYHEGTDLCIMIEID